RHALCNTTREKAGRASRAKAKVVSIQRACRSPRMLVSNLIDAGLQPTRALAGWNRPHDWLTDPAPLVQVPLRCRQAPGQSCQKPPSGAAEKAAGQTSLPRGRRPFQSLRRTEVALGLVHEIDGEFRNRHGI